MFIEYNLDKICTFFSVILQFTLQKNFKKQTFPEKYRQFSTQAEKQFY